MPFDGTIGETTSPIFVGPELRVMLSWSVPSATMKACPPRWSVPRNTADG